MAYDPPQGRIGRTRVFVLTITPSEFKGVAAALKADHQIPRTPYFATTTGRGRVWDVVVARSADRSNIPTMGAVKDIIDDLRPQVLVLVGTAGALCDEVEDTHGEKKLKPREDLTLGDVVIAEYVDYIDFVKITDKGIFLRHYVYDHPSLSLRTTVVAGIEANYDLAASITERPPGVTTPKVICAPIVSGDKIYGGVGDLVQAGLLKPFDKSVAVEMEAVGMARAVCEQRKSFWYNPRYAVIRGISDIVGVSGNNETRSEWTRFAVHTATLVLLEFIKRLPMEKAARSPARRAIRGGAKKVRRKRTRARRAKR